MTDTPLTAKTWEEAVEERILELEAEVDRLTKIVEDPARVDQRTVGV